MGNTNISTRGLVYIMKFKIGDKLYLAYQGEQLEYTVQREEVLNGMDKIVVTDYDGEYVALTKATIVKRIGVTWTYQPRPIITLPEELFTL